MGLDFLCTLAFHQFGGKNLNKHKESPKALNRKVVFLDDCRKKIPTLNPYASELDAILRAVEGLTEQRHGLIHGAIASVGPGDTMTLIRLIHDKAGFHKGETHTVSAQQLLSAASSTRAIARRAIGLGFQLVLASYPLDHDLVKTLRKIGI